MALTPSSSMLAPGTRAPDFTIKGIDGKKHSLADYSTARALLIIFICNHCPYVQAKLPEIIALQKKFRKDGLQVIGISSNDAVQYPDDSFESMTRFAREKGINFPYLYDDTQKVAKSYGASCTPDPFLFDAHRILVFHGRINDALEPGAPVTEYTMEDAVTQVLAGKKPAKAFEPSIGCSIKWKR